jgi:hypothetical protein
VTPRPETPTTIPEIVSPPNPPPLDVLGSVPQELNKLNAQSRPNLLNVLDVLIGLNVLFNLDLISLSLTSLSYHRPKGKTQD